MITICFNNLADLLVSCASVDQQTHLPFEHIVINGSTSSEISDWLENEPQPHYRRWISERDKGISDAFNKGIQHANGEMIHLLNAGDTYFNAQVLHTVFNKLSNNPQIAWVSGRIEMKRGGIWVHVGVPFDPKQLYKGIDRKSVV